MLALAVWENHKMMSIIIAPSFLFDAEGVNKRAIRQSASNLLTGCLPPTVLALCMFPVPPPAISAQFPLQRSHGGEMVYVQRTCLGLFKGLQKERTLTHKRKCRP